MSFFEIKTSDRLNYLRWNEDEGQLLTVENVEHATTIEVINSKIRSILEHPFASSHFEIILDTPTLVNNVCTTYLTAAGRYLRTYSERNSRYWQEISELRDRIVAQFVNTNHTFYDAQLNRSRLCLEADEEEFRKHLQDNRNEEEINQLTDMLLTHEKYDKFTILLEFGLSKQKCVELLMDAVRKGKQATVERLIVHATAQEREECLHIATSNNQLEIGRYLLEQGVSPDAVENDFAVDLNMPLICSAVYNLNLEFVRLLLEFRANVNAKTNKQSTALHYAAMFNQEAIIQELLYNDADKSLVDMYGHTPLSWARLSETPNQQIIKLLE